MTRRLSLSRAEKTAGQAEEEEEEPADRSRPYPLRALTREDARPPPGTVSAGRPGRVPCAVLAPTSAGPGNHAQRDLEHLWDGGRSRRRLRNGLRRHFGLRQRHRHLVDDDGRRLVYRLRGCRLRLV